MSQSRFFASVCQFGSAIAKTALTVALAVTITGAATQAVKAAPRTAGIVVDAKSGKVLYADDPDSLRYPASLTKMMTLYLVFEALESGRISLRTKVPVSKHAASEPPSKLGVKAGSSFTVEQGIMALVTRSANDCSTAFGEFLGGSETRFGKIMTAKARALGMTRTVYFNANGLPDPRQVTTARDQARLGLALRKHFPQYYSYFSIRSFKYGKQTIGNHNRLLGVVRGVDGIKTGYTRAAGFNLVTSAQADGRSIVGVVMGYPSGGNRNAKMRKLVETYLPKASRKGKLNDMIAAKPESKPVDVAMAEPVTEQDTASKVANDASVVATRTLELPDNGPVPETRYEETAKVDANMVTQSVAEEQAPAEVAAVEEPKAEETKVDNVTTASTSTDISGWVIQVGASPVKDQADDLLRKAQDKGGKVLRSATPFTVAFVKGSEQVYRARFGGFADQDAAQKACKVLKKKGIGCWAAQQ